MKKKNYRYSYLLIIIILTCFSAVTFAKYVTSIYGMSSARVALFNNSTSIDIKSITGKPGTVTIIPLEITNFTEDKVSEVTSKFTINISHDYGNNLPLTFSLYKDKECSEIVYKDTLENYFDDTFLFHNSEKETKKLYLRIEWPINQKDYQNVFEIDHITVNFRVTQID